MARYQILTLNQISSHGLQRFPAARYTVGKGCEQPDAILVRSHDMHAMAIAPSVKAIGRAGAGTNNIPVAEMSGRGVPVFNAPGANANAVKELVLAALLIGGAQSSCRHCVSCREPAIRPRRTSKRGSRTARSSSPGIELPHRTLGIVGLGAIGAWSPTPRSSSA